MLFCRKITRLLVIFSWDEEQNLKINLKNYK